jgi:hypothetical protein
VDATLTMLALMSAAGAAGVVVFHGDAQVLLIFTSSQSRRQQDAMRGTAHHIRRASTNGFARRPACRSCFGEHPRVSIPGGDVVSMMRCWDGQRPSASYLLLPGLKPRHGIGTQAGSKKTVMKPGWISSGHRKCRSGRAAWRALGKAAHHTAAHSFALGTGDGSQAEEEHDAAFSASCWHGWPAPIARRRFLAITREAAARAPASCDPKIATGRRDGSPRPA